MNHPPYGYPQAPFAGYPQAPTQQPQGPAYYAAIAKCAVCGRVLSYARNVPPAECQKVAEAAPYQPSNFCPEPGHSANANVTIEWQPEQSAYPQHLAQPYPPYGTPIVPYPQQAVHVNGNGNGNGQARTNGHARPVVVKERSKDGEVIDQIPLDVVESLASLKNESAASATKEGVQAPQVLGNVKVIQPE